MSKLMDDRINEVRKMVGIEVAINLLEMGDSYEKIVKITGLTLSDVEEIAKELKNTKTQ